MGRTNPTYRMILRGLEDRWDSYRRALRHDDQPYFDRLFEHAREHADAASYLNHENPLLPAFVSMLLEHERQVTTLESRIEDLEAQVNGSEAHTDARSATAEDPAAE